MSTFFQKYFEKRSLSSLESMFIHAMSIDIVKLYTLLIAAIVSLPVAADSSKQGLIYFDDASAQTLLEQASVKHDFAGSVRYFVSEVKQTYCAVASSVIVLNSLGIPSPVAPEIYPYQKFNQQNIFTASVLEKYSPLEVEEKGLTLAQAADLLATYPVGVEAILASDSSLSEFREQAIAALQAPNKRLIINFSRQTLGQAGVGHFSPVVSYNAAEDMFLVMDVARYKLPPAWVKANLLFESLQGVDGSSGKSRGYIIVTRKAS
jgi:hypothetical protein